MKSTLASKRCAFTALLAEWITGMTKLGLFVAIDEAKVASPRKVYYQPGGPRVKAMDAQHKIGSFHYLGLAADINLYRYNADTDSLDYISDGDSEEWIKGATYWESLNPSCTSGRRWSGDANHLSYGEGSKEGPWP